VPTDIGTKQCSPSTMKTEFPLSDIPSNSAQPPRLPYPVRITEQTWPEGTVPVVSIFCITYNHEKFIRDAIEGFLMQETTFPVEIFIHDDASTDRTAQIVKEYAAKFPQLFWTVLQTENQWSKGNKKILHKYFSEQRGEFVAMCEGDDYWTTSDKLQMQVEVLMADTRAVGVFHFAEMRNERGEYLQTLPPHVSASPLHFEDIVILNDRATCSLVCRNQSHASDWTWATDLPMGDWPLQAMLALKGYWQFVPESMAVYRKHAGGAWSTQEGVRNAIGTLAFYDAAVGRFGKRALRAVGLKRKEILASLLNHAVKRGEWTDARRYLARYLTAPPQRLTLPAGQKSNVLKVLGSLLRH
jgi:glycosyltransferase involved in cell wall biosynthesis